MTFVQSDSVVITGCNVPVKAYNGSVVEDWRSNVEVSLLPNLARTATASSPMQTNNNGNGVFIQLNITAKDAGTGSIILQLVGKINSIDHILATSPAITAVGKCLIELSPGIGAASNEVTVRQNARLPRTWWVQVAPSGPATTFTYDCGGTVMAV